jgi:hypothetical protein
VILLGMPDGPASQAAPKRKISSKITILEGATDEGLPDQVNDPKAGRNSISYKDWQWIHGIALSFGAGPLGFGLLMVGNLPMGK